MVLGLLLLVVVEAVLEVSGWRAGEGEGLAWTGLMKTEGERVERCRQEELVACTSQLTGALDRWGEYTGVRL